MAALFGLKEKYKGFAGTPYFLAPEVKTGWYNHKCDVWSVGVTTFYILTGKPPFFGASMEVLYKKIKTREI